MDVLASQGRPCSLRSSQRVGHRIRQGRARILRSGHRPLQVLQDANDIRFQPLLDSAGGASRPTERRAGGAAVSDHLRPEQADEDDCDLGRR